MKKWLRRILIAAVLIGLTLAGLYECATHLGRGWLWGEAFFDGRPTSWWRCELEPWTVLPGDWPADIAGPKPWNFVYRYKHPPTVVQRIEEFSQRMRGNPIFGETYIFCRVGPPLMQGGDDAVPVLLELLDDPSPQIRELAQAGLEENRLRIQSEL